MTLGELLLPENQGKKATRKIWDNPSNYVFIEEIHPENGVCFNFSSLNHEWAPSQEDLAADDFIFLEKK